jgi:hypothetical protein
MNSAKQIYTLNDFEILKLHWLDPVIRKTTFTIINTLTHGFRSASTANAIHKATEDTIHFYLKGGNATTILRQHYFNEPLTSFPSDFDFALAINPSLPLDTYNRIQNLAVVSVIDTMIHILQKQYPVTHTASSKQLVTFQTVEGFVAPVNKSLSAYFERLQDTRIVVDNACPFELFIRPNLLYKHMTLDIGTITLRIHTAEKEPLDLMDISFFLRRDAIASDTLIQDWNMTTIMQYTYPADSHTPELDVDVYEPMSAYVNHFIAHQKNTRPEKQKARKRRMNSLKQMIAYIPARNRNTRKRKIMNAIRSENTLRGVLNNI